MKKKVFCVKTTIILLLSTTLNLSCSTVESLSSGPCYSSNPSSLFAAQITDFGQAVPMNLGTQRQAYRFFNHSVNTPIVIREGNYLGFSYTASLLPETAHCRAVTTIPVTIEVSLQLENKKIVNKRWEDILTINSNNYAVWHFTSKKSLYSGSWDIKVLHNHTTLIEKHFMIKAL